MAEQTNIAWTDKTWNPAHGCRKISEGCRFCYMYRQKASYGQDAGKVVRSKSTFFDPLKWRDPARVFLASWTDFFIEEIDEYRSEIWDIIRQTPHLTYQILTKRPANILDRLPADWGRTGYENVWLGVSVENQEAADERIETLLYVPARTRFLSVEPLLEEIDLERVGQTRFSAGVNALKGTRHHLFSPDSMLPKINWVIVGGESGNKTGKHRFRPCRLEWVESIVHQCRRNETPVFVKQLGTFLADELNLADTHGANVREFPVHLQLQQFPVQGETI